jgi:hypothetical protein
MENNSILEEINVDHTIPKKITFPHQHDQFDDGLATA